MCKKGRSIMKETKKIYKIEQGKKICGVCGGVAEYLNIDPTIVRVIWGVLAFAYGTGIVLYFICAFVFPNKSDVVKKEAKARVINDDKNKK